MLLESVYESVSGSYIYGIEACKRLAAEELSRLRDAIAVSIPSDCGTSAGHAGGIDGEDEAAGKVSCGDYRCIRIVTRSVLHAVRAVRQEILDDIATIKRVSRIPHLCKTDAKVILLSGW